jgi:hypothetical protein
MCASLAAREKPGYGIRESPKKVLDLSRRTQSRGDDARVVWNGNATRTANVQSGAGSFVLSLHLACLIILRAISTQRFIPALTPRGISRERNSTMIRTETTQNSVFSTGC